MDVGDFGVLGGVLMAVGSVISFMSLWVLWDTAALAQLAVGIALMIVAVAVWIVYGVHVLNETARGPGHPRGSGR